MNHRDKNKFIDLIHEIKSRLNKLEQMLDDV